MIEFTFDEDIATTDNGSGALDTDIYKGVTINFASLGKTGNGNNTISLDITTANGRNQTIWSAFGTIDKTWASGSENFNYKEFQAFMGVCGAKSITPVDYKLKKEDGTPVQKDGKDVVLSVVKELQGVKCSLAIQLVHDIYNGDESESNEIHSCYTASGQTYLEAKEESEAKKIDKVATRLADKYTKRWKQANAGGDVGVEAEEEIEVGGLL